MNDLKILPGYCSCPKGHFFIDKPEWNRARCTECRKEVKDFIKVKREKP